MTDMQCAHRMRVRVLCGSRAGRGDPPEGDNMSRALVRTVVVVMALTMVAAGCGGNDNKGDSGATTTTAKAKIDYASIGLWNDGPCDASKPPLKVGLMTVFESPVISL